MAAEGEKRRIEQVLSLPIILSQQIHQAAHLADSFKFECSEINDKADRLNHMFRTALRFATAPLYESPLRRISADVSLNLDRALSLVSKCKRRNVLRRVVTIVTAADFRKLFTLLDASLADMKWLLALFDHDGNGNEGILLSLPPIASNDPILSWVWSFIASIYSSRQIKDKIEAVNELASVAKDNSRNKMIIVEEGGVPPLVKLLKEKASPEAHIAAASALLVLANDRPRVRLIANELGVSVLVSLLGSSSMKVQVSVAHLVARMAEYDSVAKEDFARGNVIRPLVTLVSFDTCLDIKGDVAKKQSLHSIVQINKLIEENDGDAVINEFRPGSSCSLGVQGRRYRQNAEEDIKFLLKTNCAEALRMLARGSVGNSKRITETKGMLCLAKLIETERGDLQVNCLMTVMEITAMAESNADLRRAAFKTNSQAAKAVVDQLLKLIGDSNPVLQIPAIRSIGSLARTFSARRTEVVVPIVEQLVNHNHDVATEAAITLGKFACSDNFLCVEHTKTIVEHNGVNLVLRLLRANETTKYHGIFLLCYMALHVGDNEVSEHGRMLTALEGAENTVGVQHPELRGLLSDSISRLSVYHAGSLSLSHSFPSLRFSSPF